MRILLTVILGLIFGAPLLAQGPGVEGFGAFRFGMSPEALAQMAEVEERSLPDKPELGVWYRLLQEVDAYGARHAVTFIFDEADALDTIILERQFDGSDDDCTAAFDAALALAEAAHGPLTSGPVRRQESDIFALTQAEMLQQDGSVARVTGLFISDCRMSVSLRSNTEDLPNR